MKASVIVLAWNGMDYLEECLSAVLAQDWTDFEVIVVDNGSTDSSADLVAERFPQARLIRNARNLGFAGGCNVGLRAATGKVLVLLNQDTVVRPGWLRALVEALQANPGIGIAGSKALYPDGTIQHAGGYVTEQGEGRHYGYRQEDNGQFDQERNVDYVTGAALAISRQAFTAVGEIDEGYSPAYFEDVDWCWLARKAGFQVAYIPTSVLIHKEASTIADASYKAAYLFHRNRLRFVLKHWPLERLVDEFVPAERTWLESLGESGEKLISAVHHAYLYNVLHLASVVTGRQKTLEDSQAEMDALAEVLLTLRAVIPLKPTRMGSEADVKPVLEAAGTPGETTSEVTEPPSSEGKSQPAKIWGGEQADMMQELHQSWAVQEQPFRSQVPILGPALAAFRHYWNQVATVWYARPLIKQQNEFNAKVVRMLAHLNRLGEHVQMISDRQDQFQLWLGEHIERIVHNEQQLERHEHSQQAMAGYLSESGREVAELAYEIHKVQILLAKLLDSHSEQ
ncbi:MAG: glycosyltransferase family 2 protein [Thermoflexales bacterium]|nr:glycosyltransferase family 2 protein [Thermoflexales bacterium]